MIDGGQFVAQQGERLLFWPNTGDDTTLIQRWLVDGRRLELITQVTNWRMTISAAGNSRCYDDGY